MHVHIEQVFFTIEQREQGWLSLTLNDKLLHFVTNVVS